ncbi:putative reverse transcriptase domain-containing protein [Tanacetum coccineum]|uniref:Reverse transcriptase domain-containing protein n=1 Tax=Tanacetum coccineum TaxID=301880 RepID=A0ABQ5ATM2_9ASTR
MPPKGMSAAAILKLVADKVVEALAVDHDTRNNPNVAGGSGSNGGQCRTPPVRECIFTGFMKYGPTQFHGNEGAVELCRWFEKTESIFGISDCAERSKVKFAAATLQGLALTWLENDLRSLKLRDTNMTAYTQRFNELALLCPEAVPTEKKKVELYIKGLPENIKGKQLSLGPREAEKGQGPNVVAGTFLINNRYDSVFFDSGSDKRFVNTSFSHLIDIKLVRLNTSYEVELADGKIVSTNTVLRGCTLNLVNHLFEIDLMPIELGTFDIVIGMDWLVERDAVIVYGKKEVHILVKNEVLVVKGNSGVS